MALIAEFDDIIRLSNVLINDGALGRFLDFSEKTLEWKQQAFTLEGEVQRLNSQLMNVQAENNALQNKLKNAKLLLDMEKKKRLDTEDEKNELREQIDMVFQLLKKSNVDNDETKEKLQILSSTFAQLGNTERRSTLGGGGPFLSTINEDQCDTLGSILSVSDIDLTEDELEASKLRSGKTYGNESMSRKRKSPDKHNQSKSKRKSSRSSPTKETEMNLCVRDVNGIMEIKTEMNIKPSAPPISTDDEHYDAPQRRRAPQPPVTPTPQRLSSYKTHTPSTLKTTPNSQGYSTPTRSPLMRNYTSNSKVNARQHTFHSKTIYKTDCCQPCGKRIKFSKTALKCKDCRATCHPECREGVPLPCIPISFTPSRMQMGGIADYAPKMPPMVPALVIHCTNEVEQRGLTEVGIYRVPGSDREVKELKEKFLKGKGTPSLGHLDINVVCGALKDFFKNLKEPLITWTLWHDFVTAANKHDPQDCTSGLYQAISELPRPNRDTLAWVIMHLQKVGDCTECRMPPSNLAKVFGPTLVGFSIAEPEHVTMLEETKHQHRVVEKLLDISPDYWSNFLTVHEEIPMIHLTTPETGSVSVLGQVNGMSTKRRSFLTRTPLISSEYMTPRGRR